MAFNSFNFWLLFPIIFLIYWAIPSKYNQARKIFLIIVSYLLYMNWKPTFAIVLFGVTLVTYLGGRFFESCDKHRKAYGWLWTILSISPLLVFKYYNFLNDSLTSFLSSVHLQFALPGLNWAISIGISFFTFQAVGYMLDVYHKRIDAEHNFADYMLFVSFFPQVTSGPISKASELLPQIKNTPPHCQNADYQQLKLGLKNLLWGMFLKLVIADRLGMYVDSMVPNFMHISGANCLLVSIFYSLQIYGDFAGYSLISIGIARLLGYNLVNNFERPYFAISVTDFWRRWHISLSRWLKDYVYIPMGGSRCSKARNYWNIFVTFLVSGIWHGANWTYIVWGCFHGIAQIIEKALNLQKLKSKNLFVKLFRICVTFTIINFAWIFFRMPTIGEAFSFIGNIFTNFGHLDIMSVGTTNLAILLMVLPILFLKDLRDEFKISCLNFLNKPFFRWSIYVILFVLIIGFGVLDSGQFIYVSF